jgi:hypothetical protein
MAVRYMAGLALIALGVLVFMAVWLRLSGNIFEGLRRLCFGLGGSMAYVLPVLPVWGGVLAIWSTQRRAPVRPWVFALLSFFCLCAFLMIIGGALEWMGRQPSIDTNNWSTVVNYVYTDSAGRMEKAGGGGALGAILAWPFWHFLGSVLGTILLFLLTAFCILMAVNLTPSRLRDLFTGQAGARREQERAERERAEQQQIEWQRQQALWAQQQQQIIEQQQQPYPPQYPPQQYPPQYAPQNAPYPPEQTAEPRTGREDNGIGAWQEQAAAGQMGAADHEGRIFDRKKQPRAASADPSFVSRIFGRKKKEEYDGLVDVSEEAPAARPPRPTATGAVAQPQTRWKPEEETDVQPPQAVKEPPRRKEPEPQPAAPEREPARKRRTEPEQPVQQEIPEERTARPEPARDDSSYRRPSSGEEKKQPATRPAVPVVQQEIGTDAYRAPIKVPAKKQEPERFTPFVPLFFRSA